MALLAMGLAIEADKVFNQPVGGGKPGPGPLVVMDDFHDLEMGLVFLKCYGPSRFGGRFTCVQWGKHTICTLPISGYTAIVLLAGTLTLLGSATLNFVLRHENRAS